MSTSTLDTQQNTSAAPLLHQKKPSETLPGWPTSPRPIKTAVYVQVYNGVFEALLLLCSIAFLAFALIVNAYDQSSTTEYPRLTKALINATKYVMPLEVWRL